MNVRVELFDPTQALLDEIERPDATRQDVAVVYRMAIGSTKKPDWKKVNAAIRERWSKTTMFTIKEWAWNGIPNYRGGKR